jgi:Undecaprenyl-phosphate galactose phosphotransferase WbaP
MSAIDRAELDVAFTEIERIGPDRPLARDVTATHRADPSARQSEAAPQHLARSRQLVIIQQAFKTIAPLIAADIIGLAVTGAGSTLLLWLANHHSLAILRPVGIVLLLLPIAYWLCGLYSAVGINPVLELRQLIQINTIGFLAAAVGGILAPPLPLWCLAAWVLSVGLVPYCRATTRRWCCRRSWWGNPTLVITSGKNADPVVLALLRAPTSGFRPVAVTDPKGECRSSLMPVINEPASLELFVWEKGIRYAVICAPDMSTAAIGELYAKYAGLIPHLVVLSDVPDLPSLFGSSRSCGRLTGLEMRNGRMLPRLWVLKRVIDVLVASFALVMSLPLLIMIVCAVKLTSRGPLFYGHSRIGYAGNWFMAWKFRTMYPNGDQALQNYLKKHPEASEEWERDHKLKEDPRVTPIGKILRGLSFDELPQIWNVLKGEMSLVGPRPIVAAEVSKYGNVFKKYSAVKPGITGMWQVSGRSEISYDERVRLDEFYVANWSPWLDIFILAKTVIILLRRRGAY